jgi:hypothetical protein
MKIYVVRDNDVVIYGIVVNYRVIESSNACGRTVGLQESYTRYMTSFPWQVKCECFVNFVASYFRPFH